MSTRGHSRPRRTVAVMAVAAYLVVAAAVPAIAAQRSTSDVQLFSDHTVIAGQSQLVRTGSGITGQIHTTDLPAGDVVTVWIVVFNHPDQCAATPCSANDRLNSAVDAHAVYGGGHVVGGRGKASYGVHLNVGDDTREDLWGSGPALTQPMGAEIHFVLRTHGEMQPGMTSQQIHSASLGCNPACINLQFAVHLPT